MPDGWLMKREASRSAGLMVAYSEGSGIGPPVLVLLLAGSFKEPGKLEARKIGWIGSVRVGAVMEGTSSASAACSAALLKYPWRLSIAWW